MGAKGGARAEVSLLGARAKKVQEGGQPPRRRAGQGGVVTLLDARAKKA